MESKTQETAAAQAGMSVRSARKWQSGRPARVCNRRAGRPAGSPGNSPSARGERPDPGRPRAAGPDAITPQRPRARHQAPRPDQATEDPGARHPRAGERRTPETRCASSKRTPNSPGAAPAAPRNQNPPAGFQPGRNTPNTPRGPVARTPRISRDQSPRKPGPPDRRGVFSLQSHM